MHGFAVAVLTLGGWIVPWQHDAGVASIDRARGALHDVFLFAARLDGDGLPVLDERGDKWKETADHARAAGASVWLTIVNDRVGAAASPVLKDSDVVHVILADREAGARHRSGILALAKRLGVDGVDVDYENLPSSDRDAFTAFARQLTGELRAAGFKMSITVQPKSGETTARGPGGADWAALCTVADRLQVMLYNEHNAATGPGPVASLRWMTGVIDYGLALCPASKLVPVLKVSGMDWGPSQAEWRSFGEVNSILERTRPHRHRDGDRVPWFVYSDAGAQHTVYYEDTGSLTAKADRLRKRGLDSLMLWSLGSEDPGAVPALGRAQKR